MLLSEYAKEILLGENLDQKLIEFDKIEFDDWSEFEIPKLPSRSDKFKISPKNQKFPRGHFHEDGKKAIALHSFANHELLATEMMATALLVFPHHTEELKRFKRGVISSLVDEQKHFKLYVKRLNDLGYEFGDFILNDFFWSYMDKIKSPAQYLAVMSLTFEAANLDFAHYYKHIFKELGDTKTASILNVVLEDEISHVNLGVHYLGKWKQDKDLWTYYNELLPYPLTPARSKGKVFIEHVREKAKMDTEFIGKLKSFEDNFRVTKRKEWKQ